MGYLIMKLLHILFVVLFLGNIITAVFWKRHADNSKDPSIIGHTIKGIMKADRYFTMPGVIGLAIFGFAAQGMFPWSITTGWILWSIILFVISGAVFMGRVVPIQKKLIALTASSDFNQAEYQALSKQWDLWGTIATVAPLIAVILMVLKVPH